jgi:aminopeptidase N
MKVKFSIFVGLVLCFTSCMLIGINAKHKTPKRCAHIPVFTKADSLLGHLNENRSCYDVHFYELNVALYPDIKQISGVVKIHYTALQDFQKIQIDLHPNFEYSILYPTNVTSTRDGRFIFLDYANNVPAHNQDSIIIQYWGKPIIAKRPPWDGGFVYKKDKDKNLFMGVTCELLGASTWWPLKDHLSDEPDSMVMNYFAPHGLKVISNGVLLNQSQNASIAAQNIKPLVSKTSTFDSFKWKVNFPINSYNATFYLGNYKQIQMPYTYDSTKLLNFYVLPENQEVATTHFKQTSEILHVFESIFGEYPYWKDGYKLVESPYEGMEHQTAIAYGDRYKNQSYFNHDYIILHETAHEWWGNSVSVTDYADIWLHEGFATYAEALYVEKIYGYNRYLNYLNYYAILIKNKKPIIGPYDVNYWDYHDSDPYLKGALVLHTLRNTINNDSLFFDVIKSFYYKNKYKTVTTIDFVNHVNKTTKFDYTPFFDQYLYSREVPLLEIYRGVDPSNGLAYIDYRWKNNLVDNFSIPLIFERGTSKTEVYPTTKIQRFYIKEPSLYINTAEMYITQKRFKKPLID